MVPLVASYTPTRWVQAPSVGAALAQAVVDPAEAVSAARSARHHAFTSDRYSRPNALVAVPCWATRVRTLPVTAGVFTHADTENDWSVYSTGPAVAAPAAPV